MVRSLYEGSIKIPHGETEVRALYGDIGIERVDGRYQVTRPQHWEERNCVVVRDFPGLNGRPLYVHRLMIEPLRAALTEAEITCPEYKIKTIGCFSPRYKRSGSGAISLHSWAVAVDINALQNPMKKPLTCDMPSAFIAAFKRAGFTWGGDFKDVDPDPMHFQLADGY